MARDSASTSSGGTSKSGNPCPKLTAECLAAKVDIVVKIVVPTQLTPSQKKLLEELGESLGTPKLGAERGFFDKLADALGDAFNG